MWYIDDEFEYELDWAYMDEQHKQRQRSLNNVDNLDNIDNFDNTNFISVNDNELYFHWWGENDFIRYIEPQWR